jgi:DNA-binding response OmpR family regulator
LDDIAVLKIVENLSQKAQQPKTSLLPTPLIIGNSSNHTFNVNPSHYKMAILDIMMPGLNGLQLYYKLKAINRNIKILFISALDAVPELISILPDVKTTNDIIKKPVAPDDFIMAIS